MRPASTAGRPGSSTCTTRSAPGTRRARSADVNGDALGQRLCELVPGAVVGEHPVATWALHRRRERPGTGDLHLERSFVALRVLLQEVEILAEHRDSAAVVDAGCVGQPPPGRLQVSTQPLQQGHGASDHARPCAARGQLRQVDEVGKLAGDEPQRLRHVAARQRPDPGRSRAHRRVAAIVALPSTRVPS
jgi:hypothetical protein